MRVQSAGPANLILAFDLIIARAACLTADVSCCTPRVSGGISPIIHVSVAPIAERKQNSSVLVEKSISHLNIANRSVRPRVHCEKKTFQEMM